MWFRVIVCSLILLSAQIVSAAGTVQLELIGDPREAAFTLQAWGQALDRAGIRGVRLRSGDESIGPAIETRGDSDHPLYLVTGRVISDRELLLPGGKFTRGDLARLKQWLADLAEQGPSDQRPAKAAFGLTQPQFAAVKADLARPVDFSTQGLSRRDAVEKIARGLKNPLQSDEGVARVLEREKIEDELSGLTAGTALACLLRPAGLGVTPQNDRGRISYMIVKSQSNSTETWPVGWTPDQPVPKLLPGLYRVGNVSIQDYTVSAAMEAVGKRVKTPVLYDRRALAAQHIDPAKVQVTVPPTRLTYGMALRKLLSQAGLKYEIRIDEAGVPFFWITTAKPS
jgi:hypothetical protein